MSAITSEQDVNSAIRRICGFSGIPLARHAKEKWATTFRATMSRENRHLKPILSDEATERAIRHVDIIENSPPSLSKALAEATSTQNKGKLIAVGAACPGYGLARGNGVCGDRDYEVLTHASFEIFDKTIVERAFSNLAILLRALAPSREIEVHLLTLTSLGKGPWTHLIVKPEALEASGGPNGLRKIQEQNNAILENMAGTMLGQAGISLVLESLDPILEKTEQDIERLDIDNPHNNLDLFEISRKMPKSTSVIFHPSEELDRQEIQGTFSDYWGSWGKASAVANYVLYTEIGERSHEVAMENNTGSTIVLDIEGQAFTKPSADSLFSTIAAGWHGLSTRDTIPYKFGKDSIPVLRPRQAVSIAPNLEIKVDLENGVSQRWTK